MELTITTSPAYSAVSMSLSTTAEAVTMVASVTRNSTPVFRWGILIRSSLIMISVPPEVAPALKISPRLRAISAPPARAARRGSLVTAPRGVRRLVKREPRKVQ